MKYLFLDTETGGLVPDFSLLELAYAVYDDQAKTTEFGQFLIKPESGVYTVTAGALGVNGINLAQHDKAASTDKEVGARLLEVVKHESMFGRSKLTPVGHNVAFDLAFLTKHLVSKKDWDQYVSHRVLDTAGIALFLQRINLLPQGLKLSLESLAQHLGHDTSGNHRALKDVELTIAVFQGLQQIAEDALGPGNL